MMFPCLKCPCVIFQLSLSFDGVLSLDFLLQVSFHGDFHVPASGNKICRMMIIHLLNQTFFLHCELRKRILET